MRNFLQIIRQALAGPQPDALKLKSLYFTFGGAIGLFFPFINVYYRKLGLSGTQIGLIAMLGPLCGALSTMLWGVLNDRFGKIRLLLAILAGGVLGSAAILSQVRIFLLILPLAALLSMFHQPVFPLLDSITVKMLGARSADYGLYRAWGTVGFVITCAISGDLYERVGLHVMFIAYPLTIVAFLMISLRLPNQPTRRGISPFLELPQMLRQPIWLIFAASIFLLWIAWAGGLTFLPVTIREMGGGERFVGWAFTIAAIMEIPVLLLSAPLLKKFGAARLMAIAFLGYTLRMFLYAVSPSPTWLVSVSVLQMVTYGPFLIGSIAFANQLAPLALKATSQSLLVAILNLANMMGGLLSGWMFDRFGPVGLYAILTVISLVAFGVFSVGMLTARKSAR